MAKRKIEMASSALIKPQKNAEPVGLNVKGKTIPELVTLFKTHLSEIVIIINELDRRDVGVLFDIQKTTGKLKGGFRILKCDVSQRL